MSGEVLTIIAGLSWPPLIERFWRDVPTLPGDNANVGGVQPALVLAGLVAVELTPTSLLSESVKTVNVANGPVMRSDWVTGEAARVRDFVGVDLLDLDLDNAEADDELPDALSSVFPLERFPRIKDFHRILTASSVRPLRCWAMIDHRLPKRACISIMILSSSSV